MRFPDITHIFFDLDHTLWDFDKNSGLAFHTIFRKNDLELDLEEFLTVYTPINERYWRLYSGNNVTQEELRYGRLRETFDQLGLKVMDTLIEKLSLDYVSHLPDHNFLLEGASDLLDYLYPKYALHIITNGFEEVQYKKMERSGIIKYFTTITTSEEAGVKKPYPGIFEKALLKANAKGENSIMIGDNYDADVKGAQAAGMSAILYNYYKKEFAYDCHQVLEMNELTKCF